MPNPKFKAKAIEAALAAGAIAKKHFRHGIKAVKKGRTDLVTQVDIQSEAKIRKILLEAFPDHGFLGEEAIDKTIDPTQEYLWVVDPLDGTNNYAHGFPLFCTSIALVRNDQTARNKNTEVLLGVIYVPILDQLYVASAGKGATCNGKKIHVSKTEKLIDALLVTGFSYRVEKKLPNLEIMGRLLTRSQGIRRTGSAAFDLCSIANGSIDAYWEISISPWDIAAGALIVQEAGGYVSNIRSNCFNIYTPDIIAGNPVIHHKVKSLVHS